MSENASSQDFRTEIYEAAHDAGVKNLRTAYEVAVNEAIFDGQGKVNFSELKHRHPELFSDMSTRGDAGRGLPYGLPEDSDMNLLIRRAANRWR